MNGRNRRLGTIGRAAVSTYGQSALGSIISRDAQEAQAVIMPTSQRRKQVSKCQEPCLSSTWCRAWQARNIRRGGLMRPSISPSGNLEPPW